MPNSSVARAGLAGLLFLCASAAACTVRARTLEIPVFVSLNDRVNPWRVGVVTDKEFTPYNITFRYWTSTNFQFSLHGLPDAFVKTLSPHFVAVELFENDRHPSVVPYDLIGRMSVEKLHFDGSNTTDWFDSVDLTMRFSLEQPNGKEVFGATLSEKTSSRYRQECAFCKPEPPVFEEAFKSMFRQLAKRLAGAKFEIERDSASGAVAFGKLTGR